MALGLTSAMAQTQKIGHVDMEYVLGNMPQLKQIESTLKTLESQLMKQAQVKQSDFQAKYQDYVQNGQSMAEAIRIDREKELQSLQQSIEEFSVNAQKTLTDKQAELMQPLYKQIGDNITNLAKEEGYSHVFSVGVGGLDVLFFSDPAYDLSDKILQRMGITPPAK